MTLPDERYRALLYARSFLYELLDPKSTPKVPRSVRMRARSCLRHFPAVYELEKIAERSPTTLQVPRLMVPKQKNEHGYCRSCDLNFDGGDIKATFIEQGQTEEEAAVTASHYGYGPARTQWSKRVAIYSREQDRTIAHRCPECGDESLRK